MRSVLTRNPFAAGIRPPAFKTSSLRSRITPQPLPEVLLLPLRQGNASPAWPLVEPGQRVLKYQPLAQAKDSGACALHAPTSGSVSAIRQAPVAGYGAPAELMIELHCDGDEAALELEPVADYRALSQRQLQGRLLAAGILDQACSGRSVTNTLQQLLAGDSSLLLVNAMETEPYVTSQQALLRERAAAVVAGAEILQAASLAERGVITVEASKQDAVSALEAALENSSLQLVKLGSHYPLHSITQLLPAVTGRRIPSGSSARDLGVLVVNAGTAAAAAAAVVDGEPCISRVVTVTGAPLRTPKNFQALIGTPVPFLLEVCGLDHAEWTGTVMGGSLSGIPLVNPQVPITKTSACVIATCAREFPALPPEQACIRCGHCASACPSQLQPQQLYAAARARQAPLLQRAGLEDCIECGACAYVCPSHIPLVAYFRAGRQQLQQQQATARKADHLKRRFQLHQYRDKQERDRAAETKPGAPDATAQPRAFSREQARQEIAAAVARVKTRKGQRNDADNPQE